MTLKEVIRNRILKFLKLEHLQENPNSDRLVYLSDTDATIKRRVQECKIWYYGDSDELLNFYTAMDSYGNMDNPIYNRNKEQYFWGLSAGECGIKRIHSGIPNAIVSTLVNVIGTPKITCKNANVNIDKLIEDTKLVNIINQQQMPLTLALGWGAFKIVIDPQVKKDCPLIEWYNADDVEFVSKHGVIIGIIYKDYYKYKGKDYVLIETRRVKDGDSYIEYNLYKLEKNNEVSEVDLTTIPATTDLKDLVIKGYNKILGVPSVFFFDMYNKCYGRSIIANKIDLFDDLDQDLSQASQTSRVSTPIEYYPADVIERGRNGGVKLPHIYNRQYIASDSFPNGDGELSGEIKTTQPQLNFEQYTNKIRADLDYILTGILSPATMGIEIAKKDNAEAQREKEKITIMTRNNIIDRQQIILRDLVIMLIEIQEYMQNNFISIGKNYDVAVQFNEFASPTQENIIGTLRPMLSEGAITPELFVDKVYGDTLTDEEKLKEVEWIKERINADNISSEEFENLNVPTTINDNGTEEQEQETSFGIEK